MSKPLRFTKTEMDNAAKIAIAHGVSVRLTRDGDLVIQPSTERVNENRGLEFEEPDPCL